MSDLAATAERLRVVKQASQHFLTLWALDHLLSRPDSIKHLRANVKNSNPKLDAAISDPLNHDWSLLYRGSVLDD
jgi:hypothetical protein